MFVIVISKIKERLFLILRILILLALLALILPKVYGIMEGQNILSGLEDRKPSGNPMRVDNQAAQEDKEDDGLLQNFVVKLRDFYKK
ncbi:MAG: hypothetical protein ACYDG6_10535 [Thermincolia bacterium]